MAIKLTVAEFITKARAVHGPLYDYSQVDYLGNKVKVIILCAEHGPFQQSPNNHVSKGQTCPMCANKTAGALIALSQESFILKAKARHGNTYDYSLANYHRHSVRVKIRCAKHGIFEQTPHDHLAGCGCQQCGKEASTHKQTYTLHEFIMRARAVHGELYSYSDVEYLHTDKKVTIICGKHGAFCQTPTSHIHGKQGCYKCGRQRTNAAAKVDWVTTAQGREATLYLLKIYSSTEEFYKVGITLNSVRRRYRSKFALGGYQYETLVTHTSTNAAAVYDWEQSILKTFAHLRYKPRIRFGGSSECFYSADEILAIFPL